MAIGQAGVAEKNLTPRIANKLSHLQRIRHNRGLFIGRDRDSMNLRRRMEGHADCPNPASAIA
jgi:hypothetical protein